MNAPIDLVTMLPGDVLCIRTPGLTSQLIRIGEEIHGEDGAANHIAIMDHADAGGVPWVIEARPGGVGWRDARDYLNNAYTVTNRNQPYRTPEQRIQVCQILDAMLHTPYDWPAIAQDALKDLHLPELWQENWSSYRTPPAHVVCSSLAAWAYKKVGWDAPLPTDPAHVQPSDWLDFILSNHYE